MTMESDSATPSPGADPAHGIDAQEESRLRAVRRYDVLDTPPDGAFERITAVAARVFSVPIAIVSIVDTDRIWFKSHHGIDAQQVDRSPGLCASAIMQPGPYVLPDAAKDPTAMTNPLVAGEFGLRFYAAQPLTTSDGHNLGTLCVIDREPREVTEDEISTLRDLAEVVMDELELRLSAKRTVDLESELREHAEAVAGVLQDSLLPPSLPEIPGLSAAARYHVAEQDRVGGDFYDLFAAGDGAVALMGDACGKGASAAAVTGIARWTLRTLAGEGYGPASSLARLNSTLVEALKSPGNYATLCVVALRPRPDGGAEATVALGGHPQPLVVRTDGTLEAVGTSSPLVGWRGDATFVEGRVELSKGDLLLMYSDGLLDAVAGRGSTDPAPLGHAVQGFAGATPEELAGQLEDALGLDPATRDAKLDDDIAFLVVSPR